MKDKKELSPAIVSEYCLIFISFVFLTLVLKHMSSILVPFVFSIFLYFIVSPLFKLLSKYNKMPRFLSSFIMITIGILIISVTLFLFFLSIQKLIKGLGSYSYNLKEVIDSFLSFLNEKGIIVADGENIFSKLKDFPLFSWVTTFTGGVIEFFSSFLLILVIQFFLITSYNYSNTNTSTNTSKFINQVKDNVTQYLVTKFFISLITATLIGLVLFLIGVDFYFSFAVLSFFLNFIPSIGSIISTLLPLTVAYLQFSFSTQFWLTFFIPLIIQVGIGNILEPRLLGKSLGLHPITVILSLLFWAIVWGIPGLFLAVPITAVTRIILSKIKSTKKIAEILSGNIM